MGGEGERFRATLLPCIVSRECVVFVHANAFDCFSELIYPNQLQALSRLQRVIPTHALCSQAEPLIAGAAMAMGSWELRI